MYHTLQTFHFMFNFQLSNLAFRWGFRWGFLDTAQVFFQHLAPDFTRIINLLELMPRSFLA
jgi:hypothetical protein